MKKISIFLVAALAMASCGKKYTAQDATLKSMNDSVNYALGLVNGAQIAQMELQNVDGKDLDKAVAEFINLMDEAYNDTVQQSEVVLIGRSLAQNAQMCYKKGLAENEKWAFNGKLFFQGLVNAFHKDTVVFELEAARQFFQNAYASSMNDTLPAAEQKAVKGKCPKKAKVVKLKSFNDSLNYAFGFLNGSEIKMYILPLDSTGEKADSMICAINKALRKKMFNPQLATMASGIGQNIRSQEANGLIGVKELTTDFALIKQGFINGLYEYFDQMNEQEAGEYINNAINNIRYGNVKEQGEQFLAENAKQDGVTVTESGLQYMILKLGRGAKPKATDKVKVHYHGTLINGTVFDSSVERGEPITFSLDQVIKGWTEGVQLMPVGSKFKFFIPYNLAYGAQQAGQIPPYSALIFEVELLGIEK